MPPARRSGPPSSRQRQRTTSTRQPPSAQRPGGRKPPPRGAGSDLFARVIVAVPAAIIAIIFIDLGGLPFALFMMAIGLVCMHELYLLLERWRPMPLVGFAALVVMVLAARYGNERDVLEWGLITLPVLVLLALGAPQTGRATVTIAGTLLGVYWIGFAFAHAVLLRQLEHGNAIIIDVLVGTFLADTAAYVGGRLFGRRPLAPSISPNKTVEGLFCGMFIAVVAVFFAGFYQDWLTQGQALLLGVAVAVLGPIGDLFESIVKRDAGRKDSGTLFGAHGGALDRLDAVIFTVVAGYYIWLSVLH